MTSVASTATGAAIAAHRFGLGEPRLDAIGNDAEGWLLAQIGPGDRARGDRLLTAADAVRLHADFVRSRRAAATAELRRAAQAGSGEAGDAAMAASATTSPAPGSASESQFAEHFRASVEADLQSRLATAASTARPFAERLVLFWSNHFTVSMAKASARGMVGPFEREAIRPHIAGSFEQLLFASVTHASMLRYLDNHLSAGPDSRIVHRVARRNALFGDDRGPRVSGLNENLAREVLELHTLGAASGRGIDASPGGYTQADVTSFACLLTGWRVPALPRGDEASLFDAAWHQPGPKTVLGRRYREGPEALRDVLRDIAQHPATARFVSTKLARHFVADVPPPDLVERLVATWRRSDGQLSELYRELVRAPQGWHAQPQKLKTPEEFAISTVRLLGAGDATDAKRAGGGVIAMGQRLQAAPSPAGWPDMAADWLGPDAVWKRVEWSTRVAERAGAVVDARALARASLGPLLAPASVQAIDRAENGVQALALLLMAPEFQRR